ncbi:MAG: hypothetical protein AAFQ13_12105, partial [Pseudomonadota bacterium]
MRVELASLIRLPVPATLALLMSGCASVPEAAPEARSPIPPSPSSSETPALPAADSAALAGLTPGPSVASLPMSAQDAGRALTGAGGCGTVVGAGEEARALAGGMAGRG